MLRGQVVFFVTPPWTENQKCLFYSIAFGTGKFLSFVKTLRMKLKYLCLVLLIAVSGCAAPINIRNANAYAQAGAAAWGRGDWEMAMRQYGRAVVNADLGSADPQFKASVNYEYGRVAGVLCKYEDSEKYLIRSKEFLEMADQSPYLVLLELALLNDKQGKFDRSSTYYSQLIPMMESAGLRSKYPLGAADVYDRYASALEHQGRTSEAVARKNEASIIRASNRDARPFGAFTPYGSRCEQAS